MVRTCAASYILWHDMQINAMREKALVYRFQVTKLPTILHVRDGEVREYTGVRSVNSLNEFALKGWRREIPETGCDSPVSLCGRAIGSLITSPKRIKHAFFEARKDFKYGDMTLISIILGAPVCVGLTLICLLDYHVTRKSRLTGGAGHRHVD